MKNYIFPIWFKFIHKVPGILGYKQESIDYIKENIIFNYKTFYFSMTGFNYTTFKN
ncbi:MAG: hypothetical protein ACOCWG_02925 [bacterium]